MGDTSDFDKHMNFLAAQVGYGTLEGQVEVDQIYAAYQHNATELKHPRGGGALFLTGPLFEKEALYFQILADHAITSTGSDIQDGMKKVVEDLCDEVFQRAPVEFDKMRRSGHPTIKDGEVLKYDRPPEVDRLSAAEIRRERKGL